MYKLGKTDFRSDIDFCLYIESFFFRTESIISPEILKLEQCFHYVHNLFYSSNIMECILKFCNGMRNNTRPLNINMNLKKYYKKNKKLYPKYWKRKRF